MPTITVIDGITIAIYYNDHDPPGRQRHPARISVSNPFLDKVSRSR
jgi:hypothetical protein